MSRGRGGRWREAVARRGDRESKVATDMARARMPVSLKVKPPAAEANICPGCKLPASMWPSLRAFREHRQGCGD